MDELKPCPFCGESSLRREKPNSFIPEYIHCKNCGGVNGAVSWNTRASDEVIRGLVEALKHVIKNHYIDDDGYQRIDVDLFNLEIVKQALAQARNHLQSEK